MSYVRPLTELVELGRFPPEDGVVDWEDIERRRVLIIALAEQPAPTRDEVRQLIRLFPQDSSESFGMAWTLLGVIEHSPSWPDWKALRSERGWWGNCLAYRLQNAAIHCRPISFRATLTKA